MKTTKIIIIKAITVFYSMSNSLATSPKNINRGSLKDQKMEEEVGNYVLTYSSFGGKFYCIPSDSTPVSYKQRVSEQPVILGNTPGLMGTIACYQCCVGEEPLTQENCEKIGHKNWARGENCECK